jgi:hypothetical protein
MNLKVIRYLRISISNRQAVERVRSNNFLFYIVKTKIGKILLKITLRTDCTVL